jgi:hypothetical protein
VKYLGKWYQKVERKGREHEPGDHGFGVIASLDITVVYQKLRSSAGEEAEIKTYARLRNIVNS